MECVESGRRREDVAPVHWRVHQAGLHRWRPGLSTARQRPVRPDDIVRAAQEVAVPVELVGATGVAGRATAQVRRALANREVETLDERGVQGLGILRLPQRSLQPTRRADPPAPFDADDAIVPPSLEHVTLDARRPKEALTHPNVVLEPIGRDQRESHHASAEDDVGEDGRGVLRGAAAEHAPGPQSGTPSMAANNHVALLLLPMNVQSASACSAMISKSRNIRWLKRFAAVEARSSHRAMVLRAWPVTRAVAEMLTPSTRRLATWSNALRAQRRPLYAVPVFVLTVPPQTVQRYRQRRPHFVGNEPWPTMLRPSFPRLSPRAWRRPSRRSRASLTCTWGDPAVFAQDLGGEGDRSTATGASTTGCGNKIIAAVVGKGVYLAGVSDLAPTHIATGGAGVATRVQRGTPEEGPRWADARRLHAAAGGD